MASDWSFARRPVWLLGHGVAVAAVIVFVVASSWQFERHEQQRTRDAEMSARLTEPVVTLESIIDRPPESIRFREVTATGTFAADEEVMLVLQPLDGISGHRVLTPLIASLGGYEAVVVDRGWVPFEFDEPRDAAFAAPGGEVQITGFVRTTQTAGRNVPSTGELTQIGRVDLDRLQEQIDYRIAPIFLHVSEPIDGSTVLPLLAPLPESGSAPPHLSYAVQWALFALVVVFGYGVLLARTSRRGSSGSGAA